MAIRSITEIMEGVRERFGDDTDDSTLGFIEDISDTLNDFDARSKDNTDWQTKYNELDASWRKKYKERFFNGQSEDEPADPDTGDPDDPEAPKLKTKFEELFS